MKTFKNTINWQSTPLLTDLQLASDAVCVVLFSASIIPKLLLQQPEQWLSPQEIKVLAKRKGQQQRNFLASRYCFKQLIAQHLQCELGEVSVAFNEKSQQLNAYFNESALPFSLSLSHKEEQLLLSLSLKNDVVAVDIENMTKQRAFFNIADNAFNASEYLLLKEAVDPHFTFYQLWTIKECLVKATNKTLARVLALSAENECTEQKLKFCTFVKNSYIGSVLYSQDIDFKKIHFINVNKKPQLVSCGFLLMHKKSFS